MTLSADVQPIAAQQSHELITGKNSMFEHLGAPGPQIRIMKPNYLLKR